VTGDDSVFWVDPTCVDALEQSIAVLTSTVKSGVKGLGQCVTAVIRGEHWW